MTGYDPREDSPGLGPSSATSGSSRARTAPLASGSANSVVVPGSVILPNSDSQGRRTVIDLTDDSPPRRQPEVIDVDALPDRPSSYFYDGHDASRTQNEDLTMLMARRLFPRPTGHSPRPPAPRPVEPDPNAFNNRNYMRYHQEIAHPILGPGSRMGQELGPAGANRGGFGRNFLQMFEGIGHMWGAFGAANHGMMIRRESVDVSFHPPAGLDYRLGANGILHDTPPVEDAARRREEQYKAPLPARAGFTRSPTSEDVLVCPICEHELGTMSEVEGQNKIWLGKCGHVSFSPDKYNS